MKDNKKESSNLKKGKLTREELKLYGLEEKEIDTILEYQEVLPILQQDNGDWINARILHEQLKVNKDFSDWFKNQVEELDLEVDKDYSPLKGSKISGRGGFNKIDYITTVESAKEISMIAGAKGSRTSKELKERSKMARKYFIYIEKAFKGRYYWNLDREETLIKCKTLKRALIKYHKDIVKNIPTYFNNNKFVAEFCLLNEVIIGMTASEYRRRKGFSKDYPIRNSFTEKELEYVHILEQYDADLIEVQNIFNYEKRKEYLDKKFELVLQ